MEDYPVGQFISQPESPLNNSKKSYKWLWLLGVIIFIMFIFIVVWIISNSNEAKIRKDFVKLIEEANNNSTNVNELSDEIINQVLIPIKCELSDKCSTLKGRELIECAQEYSFQSYDFEMCITQQAASTNNSNLCYALYPFIQKVCIAQVFYINKNIEGCRSLRDHRDYCIWQASIKMGTREYCNEIKSNNLRDQCQLIREHAKDLTLISPRPNDTWENGKSYSIKWNPLSSDILSKIKGESIQIDIMLMKKDEISYNIFLINNLIVQKEDLKDEWFVNLSNNGKPLGLPSGEYRLLISLYDTSPEQVYLARGVVEFLSLKSNITLVVNNGTEADSRTNDVDSDIPEPVTSASTYRISQNPLEIEIDFFGLSPDDIYGDQDVSHYEIWRANDISSASIKLGESEHSVGIYVDSNTNNPSYPPQEGISYIYFIRTYDYDRNYADSINFTYTPN